MELLKNFLEDCFSGDRLKKNCVDLFLESTCACVLGLEHSCPWPREGLFSEGLSLAEVESRTQGSRPRPKTQKKIQGQGQLFRKQNLLRPRTGMLEAKDTGASVLQKKRSSKIFLQAISNSLAYPEFLIGGGLNHKSHAMTSSKFFQRESTCGTKLS